MHPKRVLTFLLLFFGFQLASTPGQQVVATWTDTTGNWSNPANWSTLTVPNNGGGTTYSVTIAVPSSSVAMDVLNVTVDNLTLGATDNLFSTPSTGSLNLVSGGSSNSGDIRFLNATLDIGSNTSLINNGPFGGNTGASLHAFE